MKRALIIGIGGQDGSYLAKLLLEKGYEVVGTSRDAMASSFANLSLLFLEFYTVMKYLNSVLEKLHFLETRTKKSSKTQNFQNILKTTF